MDTGRRTRNYNYDQEVARTRSNNRKPPLGGNWQQTVPLWEKKFCAVVGSVPWQKVLDTKKVMHMYDNVLKWDDSAGEEAFINAKNRFWAQLNGLRCDLLLPDPDIYIDKIDWNSNTDSELLLDLEREFVIPDGREEGDQVVIIGKPILSNNLLFSTGWGDLEENLKKTTNSSLENKENPWEQNCAQVNEAVRINSWGDVCNSSWGGNEGNEAVKHSGWDWEDSRNNSWGWNQPDNNTAAVWEPWDANNGNRESNHGYMSRYKTSRFHEDDHVRNPDWKNGKGKKRGSFVYDQPCTDKRPASRQWNLRNSFAPVVHHGPARSRNQWS